MRNLFPKTFLATWIAVGAVWAGTLHAQVAGFVQVNLVSDIPKLAAITDPELVNPWGVSHSTTSPFWTSNQGTNTATLYTVTDRTTVTKVNINPPADDVMIPPGGVGAVGPTGQVNNTNQAANGCNVSGGIAFPVKNGGDGGFAHFIFANLNGTISAWDTGATAFIQATAASGTAIPGWRSTAPRRALCRQRCGNRQHRCLRLHLHPAKPRGRRIRQSRAAYRARPVQRAGYRRQRLRGLCALRSPRSAKRRVRRRGRGDIR